MACKRLIRLSSPDKVVIMLNVIDIHVTNVIEIIQL